MARRPPAAEPMPESARSDLGVVSITLAGIFLVYQACSSALGVVLHLSYLREEAEHSEWVWEAFLYLGPTISIAAAGLYFIFGRYSIAQGLFGGFPQGESSEHPNDPLMTAITAVGLLVLVFGLQSLARVTTQWIGDNISDPLVRTTGLPNQSWPHRVSAVVEVLCGYFLVFRAPSIASYLRATAR